MGNWVDFGVWSHVGFTGGLVELALGSGAKSIFKNGCWARLAAITAVKARYGALCYAGGTVQQHATAQHAQAEAKDDWRFDDAFREREEDA